MKITPHHPNGFPRVPKHSLGIAAVEHLLGGSVKPDNHDEHHMIFKSQTWLGDPVLHAVCHSTFSVVLLPRSWHDLIHDRFDRSSVPDRDAALGFLDETAVVERWLRWHRLGSAQAFLTGAKAARARERHEEVSELIAADMPRLRSLEFIPVDMLDLAVASMLRRGLDASPLQASIDKQLATAFEVEGGGVDAKPHPGRLVGRVVKDVAEVTAAVGALDFHPVQPFAGVFD